MIELLKLIKRTMVCQFQVEYKATGSQKHAFEVRSKGLYVPHEEMEMAKSRSEYRMLGEHN